MEKAIFVNLTANFATLLTILLHLSGVLICREIYRVRSTASHSSLPFLIGSLCGFLWLHYGLLLDDLTLIRVNLVGFTVQSLYLAWFFRYTTVTLRNKLITRLVALLVAMAVIHCIARYTTSPELVIGPLACFSSLLFCASPMALVFGVITSRSTESLPFGLILSQFLASVTWCAYGHLIGDPFVQLPNAICTLISGIQLSLFLIYPSSSSSSSSRNSKGKRNEDLDLDKLELDKQMCNY